MADWNEARNSSPAQLKNFCFSHPEVRAFQEEHRVGILELLLAVFYYRTETSNVGNLPYDSVLETILAKFRPDDWWSDLHGILHPEHLYGSLADLSESVELVVGTQHYLVSRVYVQEATKLWVTDWQRALQFLDKFVQPYPNVIFDVLNGDFDREEARSHILTYMASEARVRLDGEPTIFPHIVGPLLNAGLIRPEAIRTFQQITDACVEIGETPATFFRFLKRLPSGRGVPVTPLDLLNEPTGLEQLLKEFG